MQTNDLRDWRMDLPPVWEMPNTFLQIICIEVYRQAAEYSLSTSFQGCNGIDSKWVRLSHMSGVDRRQLPCIGDDRANLVVAGCAILESILDIWPSETLGVADRGIREGILRSLMAADFAGAKGPNPESRN